MKEILNYLIPDVVHEDNYRSSWLQGLELDRYYPSLKLAFEYQGAQHTRYVPQYHSTYNDLRTIKEHDRRKRKFCRLRAIRIVYIECWHLSIGQVAQRIRKSLFKEDKQRLKKGWLDRESVTKIMVMMNSYHKGQPGASDVNQRCRAYKKYVKAQHKSGAWKAYMPGRFRRQEYNRNRRRRQHLPLMLPPNQERIGGDDTRRETRGIVHNRGTGSSEKAPV